MEYEIKDYKKLIKRTYGELRSLYDLSQTNCMRVYDRNIQEIPVTVEVYDQWVHIVDYGTEDIRELVIDATYRMLYLPKEHIIYETRQKRSEGQQHELVREQEERTLGPIEVKESGLSFLVDLESRIDTGLFLDHLPSRVSVREHAYGKRVLNLFCYTGSFSVYAAAGGAKEVTSVDLSATYLQWARENMGLNSFTGPSYRWVNEDVRTYLENSASSDGPFDIIILDPPSFSNSRKTDTVLRIQEDYLWYLNKCLDILSADGFIVFSTNLKGFHFDPGRLRRAECRNITKESIPPAFSTRRVPHLCYMITHRPGGASAAGSKNRPTGRTPRRTGSPRTERRSEHRNRPSKDSRRSQNRT